MRVAERPIGPMALGRKKYLVMGSSIGDGASRLPTPWSRPPSETASIPQRWFAAVPGHISDYQINRIDDPITISSRHTPMSDFDRWCDSAPDCPLSKRAR